MADITRVWPEDEYELRSVVARIARHMHGDALRTLANRAQSNTEPWRDHDIATEHVGWTLADLLLGLAMDVAADHCVLGRSDGDGRGGSYFLQLEHHVERHLGPAPEGPPKRKTIPQSVRRLVYERNDFACVKCGSTEDLSIDHIIPWSCGGSDEPENLQTLCRPCNSRKGNRTE